MRSFVLVFAVLSGALACESDNRIWSKDKQSDTPLFRFVVDDKAGYIDASGKIAIPPRFKTSGNHGGDFFHGIAEVSRNSVDVEGRKLFDGIAFGGHLADDRIPIRRGNRTGFADHTGKLVIPAIFDAADNFSEGLAIVLVKGKWGYIDRSGTIVIKPQFLHAEPFAEGVARVITGGTCAYYTAGACGEQIYLGLPESGRRDYDHYPACKETYINRKGSVLFPFQFKASNDFSEELAGVCDQGRCGFVDKAGITRIELRYRSAGPFVEGLAKVLIGSKWGFINKRGEMVIPPQFEYTEDFSTGVAVVGIPNEKFWFIDKTGKQLFGRTFTAASTFRLGLAHVSDGRTFSYIDRTGRAVFSYSNTRRK